MRLFTVAVFYFLVVTLQITLCDSATNTSSYFNGRWKRQVLREYEKDISKFFPKNTYIYYMEPNFKVSPYVDKLHELIRFFELHTCIRFRESAVNDEKKISGKVGLNLGDGGCYAEGRDLFIGHDCRQLNILVHEFMHVLGFPHTHQRKDRDDFVRVIRTEGVYFTDGYGIKDTFVDLAPFDYGSVMAYRDNEPACYMLTVTKGSTVEQQKSCMDIQVIDRRYHEAMDRDTVVQFYDIFALNQFYCKGSCSGSANPTKCSNGGYPHPNNCTKCICPRGFAGETCTKHPGGCGKILTATSEFQRYSVSILTHAQDKDECFLWIQAPEGKRIEYELDNFILLDEGYGRPKMRVFGHDDVRQSPFLFGDVLPRDVYNLIRHGVTNQNPFRIMTIQECCYQATVRYRYV